MEIEKLREILKNSGIVGAGGAGFPTFVKIDERANTIIMNCAECEPLLQLHKQLLEQHANVILETFQMIADTVGAEEIVIGIKKEYKATIRALNIYLEFYPKIKLHLLPEVYPMGDEIVMIYEVTGKVIKPGGLPIDEGIAVFNVETVYNIYKAITDGEPVASKLVSVVGEVEHPITVRVPIGCEIKDVVALAGKVTVEEPIYFIGGPMMGSIGYEDTLVTKTTNAVIVLPNQHILVQRKQSNTSIDLKRAASSCCQCQMCTDLCPRHALGHPIEPHKFMRSAANQDFQDASVFLDTYFCSSCGICELFSCPQSLSPRTLIAEYKSGLRQAGVKPPSDRIAKEIKVSREYRKVPENRLEARLGLSKYNKPAPLDDTLVPMKKVRILLGQHIGALAIACVNKGDFVKIGDMVAEPGKGLSVAIHASVEGKVIEVTSKHIMILAENQ
ncbi:MAG: 4Fe-4S dicluster domain-containing protein [Eubacteriales bacterium]